MTEERRIWTAGDWAPALEKAKMDGDSFALRALTAHGIHADHCDGWEVAFWPCLPARGVLERLYGVPAADRTEEFSDRLEEERRAPKPRDVVDSGFVAADKDFRYRTKVMPADYSFRYEVTVEKQNQVRLWDKVGSEWAATMLGARMAARKLRRRHLRRFGR